MLMRITHRHSGELIAEGPRGWGITPFEGNFYIRRRHLNANEHLARLIVMILSCAAVACLLIAVICLIIDTTHSELRHIEQPSGER